MGFQSRKITQSQAEWNLVESDEKTSIVCDGTGNTYIEDHNKEVVLAQNVTFCENSRKFSEDQLDFLSDECPVVVKMSKCKLPVNQETIETDLVPSVCLRISDVSFVQGIA